MRIVRSTYQHVWHLPWPGEPGQAERSGEAVVETRILFNRFETKVIDGVRWLVGYVWAELVVDRVLLWRCRWLGVHGRACRGRGLRCHHPETRDL